MIDFREIMAERQITLCDLIDECLLDLGRLSIELFGCTEQGLDHLSGHMEKVLVLLALEEWRATLH